MYGNLHGENYFLINPYFTNIFSYICGKNMIKWIKSFFTKPKYIITKEDHGVKYYYVGAGEWTPLFEGAKVYREKPVFSWALEYYKIEEI